MKWDKFIKEVFQPHKGKIIGALAGLVFGLITIAFGFWKAFFLAICIYAGFLAGKQADRIENFKELLKRFKD